MDKRHLYKTVESIGWQAMNLNTNSRSLVEKSAENSLEFSELMGIDPRELLSHVIDLADEPFDNRYQHHHALAITVYLHAIRRAICQPVTNFL